MAGKYSVSRARLAMGSLILNSTNNAFVTTFSKQHLPPQRLGHARTFVQLLSDMCEILIRQKKIKKTMKKNHKTETKTASPSTESIMHATIIGIGVVAAISVAIGLFVLEMNQSEPEYHADLTQLPSQHGLTCKGTTGPNKHLRVFTPEQLATFDGTDPTKPLLLVVLGKVFDVTAGASHYGKGVGYNAFVGKSNSRAFYSGEFDKVRDDVLDLTPEHVATVASWEKFYLNHEKYQEVGVVVGLYFDCEGNPTPERERVFKKAETVAHTAEKEATIMKEFPICTMHSTAEETNIRCEDGKNPYLLQWPEVPRGRCGCVHPSSANLYFERNGEPRPTHFGDLKMSVYPGCKPFVDTCHIIRQS